MEEAVKARSEAVVLIADAQGAGSGLLIGPDGWILTNRHVAPSGGPFRVVLSNGRHARGIGVHQHRHLDLALVKIAAEDLPFVDLERDVSTEFSVGTEVFAVGHPRGCHFSVSRGIVSNPYREIDGEPFVQTDVSINPGNSGGPLLDREGRLVGIVTIMIAYAQGLGFAVPAFLAADYVRFVRWQIANDRIRVSSELLDGEEASDLAEVVLRGIDAVVLQKILRVEEDRSADRRVVLSSPRDRIEVRTSEGGVEVSAVVATLGAREVADSGLLREVLACAHSPIARGTTLALHEGALRCLVRRAAERLQPIDVFEAVEAVRAATREIADVVMARSLGSGLAANPEVPVPSSGDDVWANASGLPVIQMPDLSKLRG